MACSTGCTRECRGVTCRSATAWQRCTAGSDDGRGAGCGTEFSSSSSAFSTGSGRSSGRSGASMVRASRHIRMQREPATWVTLARDNDQGRHRRLGKPMEPPDHALGRSRGGFTTKLQLVTDGRGLPLAVELSAGEAAESKYAAPVLSAVNIPQSEGRRGRPRTRPEHGCGR